MIKFIVIDLDGMFLNNKGLFDIELFNKVYIEMQKQGMIFVVCIGKQCEWVEKLFGEYGNGIWVFGDSVVRIKKDGEVVKEFSIE